MEINKGYVLLSSFGLVMINLMMVKCLEEVILIKEIGDYFFFFRVLFYFMNSCFYLGYSLYCKVLWVLEFKLIYEKRLRVI